MNKAKTFAVALAVMAVLVAGCSKNTDNKVSDNIVTTTTENVNNGLVTTTTVQDNAAEIAACRSEGIKLGSTWIELANTLQEALDNHSIGNSEVAQAAADAIHRGVTASRSWIARCGDYFPSVKSNIESKMDELEADANALEDSANSLQSYTS